MRYKWENLSIYNYLKKLQPWNFIRNYVIFQENEKNSARIGFYVKLLNFT